MMDSWSQFYNRPTTPAEQIIYTYLIRCAELLPPEKAIAEFKRLFLDGTTHTDANLWRAIGHIVNSQHSEREFKFILNRSFYIYVNRWLMRPQLSRYIPQLVNLLENLPENPVRSRTGQKLRLLVHQFYQTDQYHALRNLSQVIQSRIATEPKPETRVRDLIHRYPCLFDYTLLTEDSPDEQRHEVRKLRQESQQQFETDLSRYIAYRKINTTSYQQNLVIPASDSTGQTLYTNPTLLSDRQLDYAITYFGGRMDGKNTQQDLARKFLAYSRDARSYRSFKDDLYVYLIQGIDPKYGQSRFNQRLYQQLQTTLPENDAHKMNEMLLVNTCRKLLNFLVVESTQNPQHFVFNDLTSNLGVTRTIGLLMRVVLLCHKVRYHLEKRFAILFTNYEDTTRSVSNWLVEALENLNVALSINFGTVKLS
jgi:hypothetical protein